MTRARSSLPATALLLSLPLVLLLTLLAIPLRSAEEPAKPSAVEKGFTSLFDGKTLAGWKGLEGYWSVEDGAITGTNTRERPLQHNTFLVWQDGRPADFELRFTFRIVGGNSGLQYRSKLVDEAKFIVAGYQADIDGGTEYGGMLYEERGRAFIAWRGERVTIAADGTRTVDKFGERAELLKAIRAEDWNDYVIVAKGNHLRHWINGTLMAELTDLEKEKAATEGILAIQLHSGPPMKVQVRNIRLKKL